MFIIISCKTSTKEIKKGNYTTISFDNTIEVETAFVHDTIAINTWISNVGDTTLLIKYIKTSCGCTEAYSDKNEVLQNDSAKLVIKFVNHTESYFSNSIYIFCNVVDSPVKIMFFGRCVEK